MQFADDMLILMEGEEHNVLVLKSLSKWLWRYPVEHQSLSAAVTQSKFGHESNIWDAVQNSYFPHRSPWKDISQVLPSFVPLTKLCLGEVT